VDHRLAALGPQSIAQVSRPPILPDDRSANRPPRSAIPNDHSLALIRDPDGRNITGRKASQFERFRRQLELSGRDFVGVVLNPAIVREELAKLTLSRGDDIAIVVKDDRPG
jgi:hypothetical protein